MSLGKKNKIELNPFNFLLLRTPLFPFPSKESINSVSELRNNVFFLEALYLSSVQLYDRIHKLERDDLDKDELEKILNSLARYYLRMSYRCTPFGISAGVSKVFVGSETNLSLKSISSNKKYSRLDMDYLCALSSKLSKIPELTKVLNFYPNDTIYAVSTNLRYIEYRFNENIRSHHLVDIENSSYVTKILTVAKTGASLHELVISIVDEEISYEEAEDFILEMIDNQLLFSELEPSITGISFATLLTNILGKHDIAKEVHKKLTSVISILKDFDNHEPGLDVKEYRSLVGQIEELNVNFNPSQLFQVDLAKPTVGNSVNCKIVEQVKKAITLLLKVNKIQESKDIERFKEKFLEKYELQEIALVEALDSEIGIGYPVESNRVSNVNALLKDLYFENNGKDDKSYTFSKWHKFLLEKYVRAKSSASNVIEIKNSEILPFLDNQEVSLPPSFYSLVSVLSPSINEIDKGNYEVVHLGSGGSSAANLLGRFGHIDSELECFIKSLADEEQKADQGAILAEIVHISQARLGNILSRPVIRDYEIPILTKTGVSESHSFKLDDLFISIRDNRIVLKSIRLNKEVIPKLTTAHNYSSNSLPQYRFLCDLQLQNVTSGVYWDWGPLTELDFLPQVKYGKVILSKARWVLSYKGLNLKGHESDEEIMNKLHDFLKTHRLPNLVTLAEGDNHLLLYLDNDRCKSILIKVLKKIKVVTLEECLFNEGNLFVESPEGKFTNEFIIPFINYRSENTNRQLLAKRQHSVERKFPPGSEWCYVKIYCGIKSADKILTLIINPMVEFLIAENKIDKWFFIRYGDPENNLRIRFHCIGSFFHDVINILNSRLAPYFNYGLVEKIQIETYERELERYGEENIENTEDFFWYDSTAVLKILACLDSDNLDDRRWHVAIKGIDSLLDNFNFNIEMKMKLLETISETFRKEFDSNNISMKKQLSEKYRQNRYYIQDLITESNITDEVITQVLDIFRKRGADFKQIHGVIKEGIEAGSIKLNLIELTASYIHMFLNRLLSSNHRVQEMVIYDLLYQHYRAEFAIKKIKKSVFYT